MGYESDASDQPPGVWRELDALVGEVQQARTAVAAAQAHEAALLARAVGLVEARAAERRAQGVRFGNDLPLREVSAELATAMRVGDRTVQRRIDDAYTVVTRFPATFDAWSAGRIERQHVMTIVDEGVVLSDESTRGTYEDLILAVAEVESAGRLREIARVIAARVDPEASALRRKAALRSRDVRVIDLDDGISRLLADLPSPLAHAIMDRLQEFAGEVAEAEREAEQAASDGHGNAWADGAGTGDANANPDSDAAAAGAGADGDGTGDAYPDADAPAPGPGPAVAAGDADAHRTLGEIRADVFADLLLTSTPTAQHDAAGNALTGIRGEVHVTIPIATAAGVGDEPALQSGYGPVDTDLVRQLMATAPWWNRVLFDVATGAPVGVDRYRPSAELRRFLDVRDERCRFPGCTMKPWRCDTDHTVDAARGGPTCAENLAHLCRRHHVLKHASPWQVTQVGNGRLEWTSPTGRVYDDKVPSTLRFVPTREPVPEGDPPPF